MVNYSRIAHKTILHEQQQLQSETAEALMMTFSKYSLFAVWFVYS